MTEISKRVFTSLILVSIVFISLNQTMVLNIVLIYCLFQIFFEFYSMVRKIFNKSENIKLYFILLFFLIFITYTVLNIILILWFNINDNKILLFLIIACSIFSDLGGFIFGKLFKGKKLTKISPNKTYSGVIGSYLLSLLLIIIFFMEYFSINKIIFFTIIISTIAQIGDLMISYIKRMAKVKDTGSILPGHGGLLDRFDGLILSIPIGLFLMKFI